MGRICRKGIKTIGKERKMNKIANEIIKDIEEWEGTHFCDTKERVNAMDKLKLKWRIKYKIKNDN